MIYQVYQIASPNLFEELIHEASLSMIVLVIFLFMKEGTQILKLQFRLETYHVCSLYNAYMFKLL